MSVKEDIYRYLIADVNLRNLLGASIQNPKIYPVKAPAGTNNLPPNIIFLRAGEGSSKEILDGMRLVLKITTPNEDYELASQIRERLNQLLDFKQAQKNLNIPSGVFYIKNCEKNGGADDVDETTLEAIEIINYDVEYVRMFP